MAWTVLSKDSGAHLVVRHVSIPNGCLTPEYHRRSGGAGFQRKPSRFRGADAAQRIADFLNEEAALVEKFEQDVHTENDHRRIVEVRAEIAKST